jgi:hypothetical protein
MAASKKKIKRPACLHPLIGFEQEQRPVLLRDFGEWMPWIWICKAGRKWIIELDPIEGGDHPRYLTPIGAAVANHIAALGERVFNSVDALTHEGGYFAENTRDILFESMPTSYLQFKAPSLAIACTVASRLLFLPEECFTDDNDRYLPDDPIHRILSIVQKQSRTDIKPFEFESEARG